MQTLSLRRIQEQMRNLSLDLLIVTSPQNLQYLTQTQVNSHDRLNCLLIDQAHVRCLCYHISRIDTEDCEIIEYDDPDRTVELLAALIGSARSVGIDGGMQSRFLLPLMDVCHNSLFRFTSLVEEVRCIKDPTEIQRLFHASEVTDAVFADALSHLQCGMTELELGRVFSDAFVRAGVGPFPGSPMVAFGKGTADVHHIPGQTRLQRGDAVMVDTGKQIDGYYSDMTRTVFFGDVTEEQKHVYEVVLEANRAAMEKARPGATLREVHDAAVAVIQIAGYGAYFPHRTSHGIGIDYHEEPFDTPSRTRVLEEGMCFSIEPGIYLPGKFGVRIEDLVALTPDGPLTLTHAPKDLCVIG